MKKKKTQTRQLRYVDGQLQVVGEKKDENKNENIKQQKKSIKNVKKLSFFVFFLAFLIIIPFFFEKYDVYVPKPSQAQTTFLKIWQDAHFPRALDPALR